MIPTGRAAQFGPPALPRRRNRQCIHCRRAIYRQRDGSWYHLHNGSTACRPGLGLSDLRAEPRP